MEGLLFGTGGTPNSARTRSTVDGIKRIAELGLGCMEIEFVRGVKMGEATGREVAETARSLGISLSAHAPYYINLNAREPEKVKASQNYLLQAARAGAVCGIESAIFHPGVYFDDPPEKAYRTVKGYLKEVVEQLKREKIKLWLRPEVMGEHSQFGTLDEVLDLCAELEMVRPAIDIAHWHARTGQVNSYAEFVAVLDRVEARLGRSALDDLHFHTSGIAYGKKGEIKHLNLKDSDLQYPDFLRALKDRRVKGVIVCESPNLEDDALLLQNTYRALR